MERLLLGGCRLLVVLLCWHEEGSCAAFLRPHPLWISQDCGSEVGRMHHHRRWDALLPVHPGSIAAVAAVLLCRKRNFLKFTEQRKSKDFSTICKSRFWNFYYDFFFLLRIYITHLNNFLVFMHLTFKCIVAFMVYHLYIFNLNLINFTHLSENTPELGLIQ